MSIEAIKFLVNLAIVINNNCECIKIINNSKYDIITNKVDYKTIAHSENHPYIYGIGNNKVEAIINLDKNIKNKNKTKIGE